MNYGTIKKIDIADGLGVRVSLFVSGCRNHCKGCHNQITWDFNFGNLFTEETEAEILEALKPGHIAGLTVLGGEPFEEENQEVLAPFLEKVKATYPEKNIWCYTGYLYDKDILPADGRKHTAFTNRMLSCIDILVDGPYVESLKDLTLKFRGSSNQRIINLTDNCLMKL
ncbi:MAG: anaerobic ribonucleoside-triphosphate reductase activating protein [Treponema sp.]|nr:anaerobic ribonucleoside-triphosphate reductase activating protein [Candidatus Treponema equifaecale]